MFVLDNDVWVERVEQKKALTKDGHVSLTSSNPRSSARSSWRKFSRVFSFNKKTKVSGKQKLT